ncbi:PREDICTED: DNA/RNA-binding protein KIN17-like [Gekko japonicus]|uniref:DNA/RNA-binding protein KIN17-like n=1 Tax=Gekko japonicus TaxID=146911 RepID=A0ABM1KFN2_GEKJA|nr:PREDICTED: DNA/RNA-binding protein KIN17-like [Gekko japonicus]
MGKTDFLSPKAIANRIKSKGLQKLRWYCQMCQKQCRDENGFKCHCMSESHQRQLLLASENPQQFMDCFSEEFRNDFLELLRRRFGRKRVHNNIVYNEYISHREHIHMNVTKGLLRLEVINKYTAVVKLIDSGDKLKLDQTHLETVIPAPGKKVLVLNGGYRGNGATLVCINEKTFSATILIESGPLKGRHEDVPYEDISKQA